MQTRQFNANNGRFTRILVQATEPDTIKTALQVPRNSASYLLLFISRSARFVDLMLISRQYRRIYQFPYSPHLSV